MDERLEKIAHDMIAESGCTCSGILGACQGCLANEASLKLNRDVIRETCKVMAEIANHEAVVYRYCVGRDNLTVDDADRTKFNIAQAILKAGGEQ